MNHSKQHVDILPSFQSNYKSNVASIDYLRHLNASQRHCINKLINICMLHGKKSKSHSIILNTFKRLSNYGDVVQFVMTAIDNVKPVLEVKKIRVSGSTQLVPAIVAKHRQHTLAIRWLLEAAGRRRNSKSKLSLDQCLSLEIVDAFHKVGAVRQKRDELHKLAEANRALSHYRWW